MVAQILSAKDYYWWVSICDVLALIDALEQIGEGNINPIISQVEEQSEEVGKSGDLNSSEERNG